MNTSGKLCPICKHENEVDALVCSHCGALLEENQTRLVVRPDSFDASANAVPQADTFIDMNSIPQNGIGIHVAGESKSLYVPIPTEITIGRLMESDPTSDDFLDLTNLHAATMGVSRRHVLIRRSESGFEVIDLLSRNGTWLNAERLVPHKPYPLTSGSQLRIGNMRILIMHRLP